MVDLLSGVRTMERLMSGVFLLAVTVMVVTASDRWSIGDYPNPRTHPEHCNRPIERPSFICDPDKILTKDQANQLEALLENIRNNTNCPCSRFICQKDNRGYQIGISLVRKMEVDDQNSELETVSANLNAAKLFSYTNLQRWEDMGQCDENVMVFYSVEDNVLYTMTGETARKKLNNNKIGYISLNRRREFGVRGQDAFFKAIKNLVEDYRAVFIDNYREPSYAGSNRARAAEVRARGRGSASSVVSSFVLLLLATVSAHKLAV